MSDRDLASWIESQWKIVKKLFSEAKTAKDKEKLLLSLAKLLRKYINTLRTKTGLGHEQKMKAFKMVAYIESELLKGSWSEKTSTIFDALLYARKYSGNPAVEGASLRSKLTATERKQLAAITRAANARFERSLSKLDTEDHNRVDELRDLYLLSDNAETAEDIDPGDIHGNGDSNL